MSQSTLKITCAWVPGTLDRVRVNGALGTHEVPLDLVRTVLGRAALQDLYLKGRYVLEAPEDTLRVKLDQLGCALPAGVETKGIEANKPQAARAEPGAPVVHLTVPSTARGRPLPRLHVDRGGFD